MATKKTRKKRVRAALEEVLGAPKIESEPRNEAEDFSVADAAMDLVDIEQLTKAADEIDRQVTNDQVLGAGDDKPRKKKKRSRASPKNLGEFDDESEAESEEPPPPPPIEYDPEFEIMITSLVGDVVEKCKDSLDWSDPGIHWRTKVGGCVARIVQKRITRGRQIADEVVLLGYLALWIAPNVRIPKFGGGKDTDTSRNDG